jgi:hypothetical protein
MTKLTNGETMEVTEEMYNAAPRLYQWCKKCNEVTEHLKLWAPLYQRFTVVCNKPKHTIQFVYGGPTDD